jgi:hypothetical protein
MGGDFPKPKLKSIEGAEHAEDEARRAEFDAAPNTGRQLDSAHADWVKAGKPVDENDPAYQEFKKKLISYIESQSESLFRREGNPTWKRKNPLLGRGATGGEYLDARRFNEAKLKRGLKAAATYNPAHVTGAKFTTYLRKPLAQAEVDELRRNARPTIQQIVQCAFTPRYAERKSQIEFGQNLPNLPNPDFRGWDDYVNDARESGIEERYSEVAKWIARQDPHKRITWRDVQQAFPEFDSEDKAQRALQPIRDAVEQLKDRGGKHPDRLRRWQRRVRASKRDDGPIRV